MRISAVHEEFSRSLISNKIDAFDTIKIYHKFDQYDTNERFREFLDSE